MIVSIIAGMIVMILDNSFSTGMIQQMLDNQIKSHISHIQIHKKGYNDKKEIKKTIPERQRVEYILQRMSLATKGQSDFIIKTNKFKEKSKKFSFIRFYSKRLMVSGLLSSANGSSGCSLIGIEPESEQNVTLIKQSIIEGHYIGRKRGEVVIGKKLAEKLEVELGDKVVAVANNPDGTVCSELLRVCGVYKTASNDFDKMNAYTNLSTLQTMLEMENKISEYALILNDPGKAEFLKLLISKELSNEYEVLTYKELLPLSIMQIEVYNRMIIIFYLIIGVAVMFGIVNSMLMSVFERVHEIGVLMAIGMKNSRIFFMIIFEALCLGVLGTIIGFVIGYLIYLPLSNSGIDLSIFSESLGSYGLNVVIYPRLEVRGVLNIFFIVPIISIIAAIYPSIKAIKLQPTDAMRYV